MTSNRFPDKWIVPAGGVEAGEQFRDAAIREVLEEVSGILSKRDLNSLLFKNKLNWQERPVQWSVVLILEARHIMLPH